MVLKIDTSHGREHKILQLYVGGKFWEFLSHSKSHLERMMKDLIEEAERWDLKPKPASLWWTSTDADEMLDQMETRTKTGLHKLPLDEKFKILEYTFNQA